KYKRSGAHLTIDHASDNEKFRLAFSGYYTAQRNHLPGSDLTYTARTLSPNAPELYDENGALNWEDGTWENPLSLLKAVNLSAMNDLVTNAVVSWKLGKRLGFKTSLGFTDFHNDESIIYPSTMYNPDYGMDA